MILPGATLGMLGGGQLGRMFTVAARTMGYEVIVLDPDPESPAGKLATDHVCADYLDASALDYLSKTCAAVTTEFENVPATALDTLAQKCVVRPGAAAVAVTQDRIREKTFLRDAGFATAPFAVIHNDADLATAVKQTGAPAILKVARFGYDGKGQASIADLSGLQSAFADMKQQPCVLEQRVALACEVSVVMARGADGTTVVYPVAENQHTNGILDVTIVPARISPALARQAEDMARKIAEKLQFVGVLAVEFFVTRDGQLLVNEMAPRPHNSGHYTIDACVTSQFEQQVRAVCGLTLGDTRLLTPVVMINLLGDLWPADADPDWRHVLNDPKAKLHLYGKRSARPGRKMGHFCTVGDNSEETLARALAIKQQLQPR